MRNKIGDFIPDMKYALQPVDRIEITVLVDNYTDLLLIEDDSSVHRPKLSHGRTLLAEHGLSLLIQITYGQKTHTILMDAGASEIALFKNADVLGLNLDDIEEIVISHGHFDHIGALDKVLRASSCRLPVNLHPASFAPRRKKLVDGSYTDLPTMKRDEVTHAGGILALSEKPSLLCNQHILLTGEIERITSYEQGSPVLETFEKGDYVKDPFRDDQSLVLNLKNKGLIIVSGCAHAGIVNSVLYAQKITGIAPVHAIMGGFHLSGPYFSKIIPQTISDLCTIHPEHIIPMHCTGWEAQVSMAKEMPEQFLLSSVGARFQFH